MELSLNKLPWYAQIGVFVLVSAAGVFVFYHFYATATMADIESRQAHLRTLRADIEKSVRTARQLPQFQAQVADLERRLEGLKAVLPEEKDIADILRRVQGLAAQSSLTIQRFTPQPVRQQPIYAEVPIKIVAEGRYHDLGTFFDRIGKFPRIINVSDMTIRAKQNADENGPTIVAECTATTFVLQEQPGAKPQPGGRPQPQVSQPQ